MARFKTLRRDIPPVIQRKTPKRADLVDLAGHRPHKHLYGYRWQQSRQRFLRDNPLCRVCESAGLIVAATVVDHIVPHRGCVVLFWDIDNWQPLCVRCHTAKTARGE